MLLNTGLLVYVDPTHERYLRKKEMETSYKPSYEKKYINETIKENKQLETESNIVLANFILNLIYEIDIDGSLTSNTSSFKNYLTTYSIDHRFDIMYSFFRCSYGNEMNIFLKDFNSYVLKTYYSKNKGQVFYYNYKEYNNKDLKEVNKLLEPYGVKIKSKEVIKKYSFGNIEIFKGLFISYDYRKETNNQSLFNEFDKICSEREREVAHELLFSQKGQKELLKDIYHDTSVMDTHVVLSMINEKRKIDLLFKKYFNDEKMKNYKECKDYKINKKPNVNNGLKITKKLK